MGQQFNATRYSHLRCDLSWELLRERNIKLLITCIGTRDPRYEITKIPAGIGRVQVCPNYKPSWYGPYALPLVWIRGR